MFKKILMMIIVCCSFVYVYADSLDELYDYAEEAYQRHNQAQKETVEKITDRYGNTAGKIADTVIGIARIPERTVRVAGTAAYQYKRVLVGGKPIAEEKVLAWIKQVYNMLYSGLEKDIDNEIKKGRDIVKKIMNVTLMIVSMIFLLYVATLVYQYMFYTSMDVMIIDYFNRQIKWAIIIVLFLTQTWVLTFYDFFSTIDVKLQVLIFGNSFGTDVLDNIITSSFKAVIPIYNEFATKGYLTDPIGFFRSLELIITFLKLNNTFLSTCFTAYIGIRTTFVFGLMLLPAMASTLLFDETREWFIHYVSVLFNLLLGLLYVIFITNLFTGRMQDLIDFYYNNNILKEGMLEKMNDGVAKTGAEIALSAADMITMGKLSFMVMQEKMRTITYVYCGMISATPFIILMRFFMGRLGQKKIG